MRRSRVRHGTVMASSQTWPSHPADPSAARMKSGDAVETVGLALLTWSVSVPSVAPAAACSRIRGVAAVDQPDRPRRPGLRLEGDDAGAEAAEGGDAVADMGADVEGEIAGFDEAAIERVHGAVADRIAI